MANSLTLHQKEQFNEILEELGKNLDISETQHNVVAKSYDAVGLHLAKHDSPIGKYDPQILPQGSFMLGTMIQPIHEKDDLDVDLVCQLVGKQDSWTQFDLKKAVGDQLKSHGIYNKMIKDPEGRRCWTLVYSETANYHLDILPCIVDSGYRILLEKAFSNFDQTENEALALRITDTFEDNYKTETNHLNWLKSNPFGYANWFFQQATLDITKAELVTESIKPIPEYSQEKLPLQRIVQILKRHRDMMFDGNEHKPISIIITTLAAKAYRKETNILEGLLNVAAAMKDLVTVQYSHKHNKNVDWIENPINSSENFADKWVEHPQRKKNFNDWIDKVQQDIFEAINSNGLHVIRESLEKSLGQNVIDATFSNIAEKSRQLTESGKNRIDAKTGITSLGAATIKPHTFYGEKDFIKITKLKSLRLLYKLVY